MKKNEKAGGLTLPMIKLKLRKSAIGDDDDEEEEGEEEEKEEEQGQEELTTQDAQVQHTPSAPLA